MVRALVVMVWAGCAMALGCSGQQGGPPAPVGAPETAAPAVAAPVATAPETTAPAGEAPGDAAANPAADPAAPKAGEAAGDAPARHTEKSLDITWVYEGELTTRMDGETLVVSGPNLPEVRVDRKKTPVEVGDSDMSLTGLGNRYFGPVWLACATDATGEAAARAEAFCASIRPVEHPTAEVVGCDAPEPHDKFLVAFLSERTDAFMGCLRKAQALQPNIGGIEAGMELRFTGEGFPARLGLVGSIAHLEASRAYDDCVYAMVKGLKYEAAAGATVDARCKMMLTFYGN
jgi:hypothetical protein